jgi:hypothetical protein
MGTDERLARLFQMAPCCPGKELVINFTSEEITMPNGFPSLPPTLLQNKKDHGH